MSSDGIERTSDRAGHRLGDAHINEWLANGHFRDGQDEFEMTAYTYGEYHPVFMVMSKESPFAGPWMGRLGSTIQEMIDDGTMKRIVDTHVPGWYEPYAAEYPE